LQVRRDADAVVVDRMGLRRLAVHGLRCFETAELEPAAGLNLITGRNASGKSSLLEAIFLLGRGRSFRSARREAMIRERESHLSTVGWLADGRVLGVRVTHRDWSARLAGEPLTQLAQLANVLPVQLMDPDIHRLVQEGPGERRRYLDWATFHVKPDFLATWREYQKALRQRNAALRSRQDEMQVKAWERALADAGRQIDEYRRETVEIMGPAVGEIARELLGADLRLEYRPGQGSGQDLAEALAYHRQRDQRAGMTQVGPHRADLALSINDHRTRGWVSRGQQKLVASAMVLGQARLLAPLWGGRGVLLVDDPAAELDHEHCAKLLSLISSMPFQTFLTALDAKELPGLPPARTFHVEQGHIAQVV
jgi:DNA replication and repair protein RecF